MFNNFRKCFKYHHILFTVFCFHSDMESKDFPNEEK